MEDLEQVKTTVKPADNKLIVTFGNMKKLFLMLAGAMMICAAHAQVLEEGESALVYYSPKTALVLEFNYTVETQERGLFAEYAEEMLGVTDFVQETSSVCTIKDVMIGTTTATDYNRPHKVNNESGIPMLLNISDKGLLTGYNVPMPEKKATPKNDKNTQKPRRINSAAVAPYPEEVLKAATPQAQAFEVAKQIFHIRETRMYLLNGEVEHAPADGKAMELVLGELDKQERELTELFIGKKTIRREQKKVQIEPNNNGELLFFSEENGFTDSDNIDADTIEVKMICQKQAPQPLDPKAKKKGGELSQIVYNIPGYCSVNVLYKGHHLASRSVPVAQYGADIAIPKSWFTGKELPKIVFSEKTGNIISISK